jgi:hypothetical protein
MKGKMKNLIYFVFAAVLIFASCKKTQTTKEEKQDVNVFKNLVYSNVTDNDAKSTTAFLMKKQSKDTAVYTMEIKYESYNEGYIQGFKEADKKLGKYPVRSSNDETGIRKEIMLSNEIFVLVESYPDYIKEFRNEALMEKMIMLFDLEGLEKLKKENITGTELVKYLPKFERAF